MKKYIIIILSASILISCNHQTPSKGQFVRSSMELAAHQLEGAIAHIPDTFKNYGPRTANKDGRVLYVMNVWDWTSGFFPGSLWYMYDYWKDDKWKQYAERFTNAIEDAKFFTRHHDVGFIIQCSFGNGYRLTGNEQYKDVVVQAAQSLSTRFNPNVGLIKSWDTDRGRPKERGWQYPVIIDNMMNLELLFNATKFSGDSAFYNIAVSHADVSMKNHFRPDHSSYHLVDFDSITWVARSRETVQGYAHESSWSRGQAWGLYGYTMSYRETGYQRYLEQAEKIADWWLTHKNMPEDRVPYWDFDAPKIPDELRDASAAAIAASALIELASFKTARSNDYLEEAKKTLVSLSSPVYLSSPGENACFVIKHCVGSIPTNQAIDVPINYGDYYFLEALIRYRNSMISNNN